MGAAFFLRRHKKQFSGKLQKINIGQDYPGTCAGNQEYLIWTFAPFHDNADLYAYNIQKDSGVQVNPKEDLTKIFSYGLIGNMILINDRHTKNMIGLDLIRGTKITLTLGLGAEHLYKFGHATQNLSYIAMESEDRLCKIVRIAISGIPEREVKQ